MKKLNVVFCGTPDFSVPALELLANHPSINLHAVITMPDRPAGRGHKLQSPPVAEFAKQHKIKLIQTENINREPDSIAELEKAEIDFFVVLAFAQFLGSKILQLPKLGCFNIHTSLLPKYRGAAPIQYALLNGDEMTGVSIQKMVKQMDAGDLVKEHPVTISPDETGGQLYTRLKFQAALTLNDLITDILNGTVSYKVQDEAHVSFAPTLKKEDGLINFETESAKVIFDKVRALKPWPGTYTYINSKRVKVIDVSKESYKVSPGSIQVIENKLVLGTAEGCLRLLSLQFEGKKACSDRDYLNGLQGDLNLTLTKDHL
ncbi:methionyl-tRNA formyltransferase [Bacteriovorax sp. Seq25_V]|uniref:methionyl-tRNA formyltransferase n=1 Tax=Bacteriovorax sp. Seq25_V TaxID=1201288 RepID=UPI000389F9F7|nr:methionyl-tRNA formyltransferase [Bacteriovorax sp. Seq25_V]EQC43347.1 methionyl-tRNA formyltransferase [Bacteriovorax sp. Seq25_V]